MSHPSLAELLLLLDLDALCRPLPSSLSSFLSSLLFCFFFSSCIPSLFSFVLFRFSPSFFFSPPSFFSHVSPPSGSEIDDHRAILVCGLTTTTTTTTTIDARDGGSILDIGPVLFWPGPEPRIHPRRHHPTQLNALCYSIWIRQETQKSPGLFRPSVAILYSYNARLKCCRMD